MPVSTYVHAQLTSFKKCYFFTWLFQVQRAQASFKLFLMLLLLGLTNTCFARLDRAIHTAMNSIDPPVDWPIQKFGFVFLFFILPFPRIYFVFALFCFKMYLFIGTSKLQAEKSQEDRGLQVVLHSLEGYSCLCWAKLNPAVRTSSRFLPRVAGTQTSGPSSVDFPRPSAESWTREVEQLAHKLASMWNIGVAT